MEAYVLWILFHEKCNKHIIDIKRLFIDSLIQDFFKHFFSVTAHISKSF